MVQEAWKVHVRNTQEWCKCQEAARSMQGVCILPINLHASQALCCRKPEVSITPSAPTSPHVCALQAVAEHCWLVQM